MKNDKSPVISPPDYMPDAPGETDIERDLSFHLVRVVEEAAMASARTMGQGNAKESDHAAVQAMRQAFETVPIAGNIVIGEGERDKAPMLYIGERVGAPERPGVEFPGLDIAVDPLEGTNLCSTGAPNAIAVLAASEPGGLLHARLLHGKDCCWPCLPRRPRPGRPRIAEFEIDCAPFGPRCQRSHHHRPRPAASHSADCGHPAHRRAHSPDWRRRLSAAIAVAVRGNGVHAVMGIGGAPEGVLAAAAMRCLHGEMVGRLVINTPELEERVAKMGIKNPKRIYTAGDLAIGSHIIFAACGITDGALLRGVRFFGEGYRTHTLVMTSSTNCVRFVDAVHMHRKPGPRGVRLY